MMHPLMKNNLERDDLDLVIEHLKQNDPKLTSHYVENLRRVVDWWCKT